MELIKLSKEEAKKAISSIPEGIGAKASDDMIRARQMLRSIKIGDTHKIPPGKTRTVMVSKKDKDTGNLKPTGKEKKIDKNISLIEQAVRYLNKQTIDNEYIVMFKGIDDSYYVSKIDIATHQAHQMSYKNKKGKTITAFNTKEWRAANKV